MRQALGLGWGHPQELGSGPGTEKDLYFQSAVGRLGDLSALWMIKWNVSDRWERMIRGSTWLCLESPKKDWSKEQSRKDLLYRLGISPWATGQAVIFKVTQSMACPTLPEPQHRVGPYTLFLSTGVLGCGLYLWNHTLCSLMIGKYSCLFL